MSAIALHSIVVVKLHELHMRLEWIEVLVSEGNDKCNSVIKKEKKISNLLQKFDMIHTHGC